jgi:transcription elongation GreA/GreB family factor
MKPLRLFDEAGLARLVHLADSSDPTTRLTPIQRQELAALLQESAVTADPAELARRITLGDRVRLISPQDPDDWYELELVLPPDTDIDADRISLFTPMGFALLGRRTGNRVAWEVPAGLREMIVASVVKLANSVA